MSYEEDKVLMPFPADNAKPPDLENSHAEASFNSESCLASNFLDYGIKEIITSNNDTDEDDFFSVQGDFSESCSNASNPPLMDEGDSKEESNPSTEKKKLAELFEDPSWNIQNDTTLFGFLQDEKHLSNAAVATTSSVADHNLNSKQQILYLSPARQNLKLDRNPKGCCFC